MKNDASRRKTKLFYDWLFFFLSIYSGAVQDTLGAFSTRSPQRPNPVALSCAYVTYIDADNGVVGLAYIDADDQSPVLDIKPYTPNLDRVEAPKVPAWCKHWPNNVEASGDFDWESEFNF